MRKYPRVLACFGIRRWEYTGGISVDCSEFSKTLMFNFSPSIAGPGPTHIQKLTKWGPGFLITWPLCFHFWFIFKQQTPGVPGSEKVLYWRFGLWRWDANDDKYIGPGTWFLGGHWD